MRRCSAVSRYSLLPILENVFDEKFQRKASKFAIFYTYENPTLLFPFFISYYFIFSLINKLVYVNIDQGIHQEKKIKKYEIKNGKSNVGFSYI